MNSTFNLDRLSNVLDWLPGNLDQSLKSLKKVSGFVSELANLPHRRHQPYVGESAFAHKGGLHVSAVLRDSKTYEHMAPEVVGNSRRVLVSDLSGRANILYKAREYGVDLDGSSPEIKRVLDEIKELKEEEKVLQAAVKILKAEKKQLKGE